MKQVKILSIAELRSKNLSFLKTYKADILKAKINASTDLEREGYANQVERVNCVLNEAEAAAIFETEEKQFVDLQRDIADVLKLTGTSSQPCVATAERPALEERM